MPYIITTHYPIRPLGASGIPFDTRTAVATLEEARATVKRAVNAKGDTRQRFEAHHLPESGKTIGPLPDGTVVEVRPASFRELADAVSVPLQTAPHPGPRYEGIAHDHARIIAAFNGDRSTA